MNFHKIVRMVLGVYLLYGHSLSGLDWFGYVADNSARSSPGVTPVDVGPATPTVFGTFVTLAPATDPQAIAITPDATKAFVITNDSHSGNNFVFVLDLTNRSGPTLIPPTIHITTRSSLVGIAITPDGTKAYVTDNNNNIVYIIDVANIPLVPPSIPVGRSPTGIAITPVGSPASVANRAYVVNSTDSINPISVIDLASNSVVDTFTSHAFLSPQYIAITPDGTTAYVTNNGGQNVIKIDLVTKGLTTIGSISDFPNPFAIAITSDGKAAYVTNANSPGNVVTIDLLTNALMPIIGAFDRPEGIAITPDNKFAYVTDNASNHLTVIKLADNSTTNIGPDTLQNPFGIAITPDQAPIAAFTPTVEPSGSSTVFDASASSTQTGTVVKYDWDFGDGNTVSTTSPTITHTYAVAGSYIVTLTVTNSAGTSLTQTFTGQTVSNNGGPSARTSQTIDVASGQPLPPTHFRGKVEKNIFATQTEYAHVLKWKPNSDPTIVGYRLFQDGELIRKVRATGPFHVTLHNQKPKKPVVYTLVSVNAAHVESTVSTVILP